MYRLETFQVNPGTVRDLAVDAINESGQLRVMPAAFYEQTSVQERAVFGQRHAAYCFPTTELVQWLKATIGGRSALEIGSGNGVLAQALGIPATDNCMQRRADIAAYYQMLRQPVVQYGTNVQELDALEAVRKHRPQVVIAAWVTHKYDPARHAAGGNMHGVVEQDIIRECESYVFIGNKHVHQDKPIWKLPHTVLTPPWLFSRAHNGSPDFIAVWGKPPAE